MLGFSECYDVHNFREFVKRQVCQNWGGVAHVCYDAMCWGFLDAMIFCNNFASRLVDLNRIEDHSQQNVDSHE